MPEWIQAISILTNLGIIGVGAKLIRHLSRMEFKVETMWSVFMRRFGGRSEDKEDNFTE